MFNKQKAFTLIELLVTVAVVGVFAAIGMPSFFRHIANNSSVATAETFVTALNYARNEALKTGGLRTLCPINATNDGCGTDWSKDWIVIRDSAATSTSANAVLGVAGSNDILHRWNAPDKNAVFLFTPQRTFIRFAALGVLARDQGTAGASIDIRTNNCSVNSARLVTVGLSGLITVGEKSCP